MIEHKIKNFMYPQDGNSKHLEQEVKLEQGRGHSDESLSLRTGPQFPPKQRIHA